MVFIKKTYLCIELFDIFEIRNKIKIESKDNLSETNLSYRNKKLCTNNYLYLRHSE